MADQNHNQVIVQIDAMLAPEEPPITAECCIYKVPHLIRKLNQDAYTPKVVSIGPFHYANPRLRIMERYKKKYFQKFIERTKTSLDNLVSCVRDLEPLVRRCYSENINNDEFVKLILVDCAFIFELFLRFDCRTPFETWLESYVMLDLILLENQLPFFILEKLYNLAFPLQDQSFIELTRSYFKDYIKQGSDFNVKHFTDMLRISYLHPRDKRPERRNDKAKLIYSASELNEAGVMFKKNTESKCLLDLQFSGRYLEIPYLEVDDDTEILFRNMVALEQCHYIEESYITDYIGALDFLINTEKDVDVLVKNGIIRHWLGNNSDVTKLFNGILKDIVLGVNSNYIDIYKNLNAYYEHPWNSRKATLRRDYCRTPWQTVASFAAIVLLILTAVQTICSIRQIVY